MKIEFLGAAREVTGSKHLITTKKGLKILLDCGMYQGKGLETDAMNRDLGFDPRDIDYIILSHAHIDHSGLIPYIYKLGFNGTVLCTPATRDLCAIMLADAGHIQESDVHTFNKKRQAQGLEPVDPIYTLHDAQACMGCFISVPYHKQFNIEDEVTIEFFDTGHILGSACTYLEIKEGRKKIRIGYTGDIGRYDKHILKNPEPFPQVDYLLMESTYGDRTHTTIDNAEQELLMAVLDTCTKKKGKLIIPSFAIGRAQEIIYALDRLSHKGLLPDIDVFVDSPLSVSATNIMRLHTECFNDSIVEYMKTDSDPFGFDRLQYVQSVEASKALNVRNKTCIIISASGMMEAGRVKHHIANNIENPKTTILCVGYCVPSTLGAKIMRGDKSVSIFGRRYDVRCDLRRIESLSGHADYEEMVRYIGCQKPKRLKQIFLVHGDAEAQSHFEQTLHNCGFPNVYNPTHKESITIQ
ncbi:MAG: MBL fold metallo-hydrolase [Bacteroidales bacterium]|nr:MBL fold metallo-hydrolase [Candidatus Colimorpha onthohippi]